MKQYSEKKKEKIVIYLTAEQKAFIKDKAGYTPMGTYVLRESGLLDQFIAEQRGESTEYIAPPSIVIEDNSKPKIQF